VGDHEAATDVFREALRFHEQHSDTTGAAVVESLLATAARLSGDQSLLVYALSTHRRTLAALRAAPDCGENDIRTMAAAMRYATDLSLCGDHAEAVEEAREQLDRYRTKFPAVAGREHPFVHWCTANLSTYLRAAEQPAEALDLSGKALAALRADDQVSSAHFLTYAVAISHANNLVAVGAVDEAAELDHHTHVDLVRFYGANYPDVAVARVNELDSRRRAESADADRSAGHLERRAVYIEMPVL
jgi:tetratricopeptide (TPR) repeat protein